VHISDTSKARLAAATPLARCATLLLGLALAGCAKQATPSPAPEPAPAAPEPAAAPAQAPQPEGGTVEAKHVDEKVTVVNPTSRDIMVELSSGAPDKEEETSTFGPVAAGEQGSGTIGVWTNGSVTVVASWDVDGKTVKSQPYTATLDPSEPLTPVTCTLNIPYDSGTLGVWSKVSWEMPPSTSPPESAGRWSGPAR